MALLNVGRSFGRIDPIEPFFSLLKRAEKYILHIISKCQALIKGFLAPSSDETNPGYDTAKCIILSGRGGFVALVIVHATLPI